MRFVMSQKCKMRGCQWYVVERINCIFANKGNCETRFGAPLYYLKLFSFLHEPISSDISLSRGYGSDKSKRMNMFWIGVVTMHKMGERLEGARKFNSTTGFQLAAIWFSQIALKRYEFNGSQKWPSGLSFRLQTPIVILVNSTSLLITLPN